MKDDRIEKALLELLRAGLWEQASDGRVCRTLTDAEWQGVYRSSCQQAVGALVCHGLNFLPKGCEPPLEAALKWGAYTDGVERRNWRMNEAIAELYAFFGQRGLRPVLQKGQGIALNYLQPNLRECGDIDLYFSPEERRKADRYMQEAGVLLVQRPDRSSYYHWQGFVVEHHEVFFDLLAPSVQPMLQTWIRKWGFQEQLLESKHPASVWIPSVYLNLLLQNAHVLKHAMGHGIGLRQFCDLARSVAVCRKEATWNPAFLRGMFQQVGLEKWSRLLFAYLEQVIGLLPGLLYEDLEGMSVDPLAKIVRRGGNFGQYASGIEQPAQGWKRKLNTVGAFVRNAAFSWNYAPKEAFYMCKQLINGQLSR